MHEILTSRLPEIAEQCRIHGVARLDVFGSAAREDFDPERSDLDFLVEFLPEAREQAFDNFFGLRDALQALLGRPIDLLTRGSLRNPYLVREIEADRLKLYGA